MRIYFIVIFILISKLSFASNSDITPGFIQNLAEKAKSSFGTLLKESHLYLVEGRQVAKGNCSGKYEMIFRFVNMDVQKSGYVIYTPQDTDCVFKETKDFDLDLGGMGFLFFDIGDVAVPLEDSLTKINGYFPDFQFEGSFYIYQQLHPAFTRPTYQVFGKIKNDPANFLVDAVSGTILLP